MEELLFKYQSFIEKNISPTLASALGDYLQTFKLNKEHNLDEIEHDIKLIVTNYLNICNADDFKQISKNLYESFIEHDDMNLTNSIKFIIRLYSKYEDLKLKKFLLRWKLFSKFSHKLKTNKPVKKPIPATNTSYCFDEDLKPKSTRTDIFDRLYRDATKKHEEKLLNDELKKLNELEECTFKPNIYKK
jgi:hypothetical protein